MTLRYQLPWYSTEGPVYAIKAWPQGYRMFEYSTGRRNKPRRVFYLYGKGRLIEPGLAI